MNTFDLSTIDKTKPIYFIGIGGISMSALAVILKNDGFAVEGSDFKASQMTKELEEKEGIRVFIGHHAENIGDVSLVVYTAAIHEDNPELIKSRSLGVPVIERAVLLGALMKRYQCPIAVSGTHGKTTTTSMLSHVLLHAKLDPTILVGGVLPVIGGNMRDGGKQYLVTEACEYTGSFLKFNPLVSIILNVEEDHLDYFKDISEIIDCFHQFAQITPPHGHIIANFDDENVLKSVENIHSHVIGYGLKNSNAAYIASNIVFDESGYGIFDVLKEGAFYTHVHLQVPGDHNVSNALSVVATADILGIGLEDIADGLNSFTGTNRRFEKKGICNGAVVIDDYAHHPTEIMATLKAARNVAKEHKVWCVFQPHTYTRAYKLKHEFATSFTDCDNVIVTDIYAAREPDNGLVHSRDLAEEINKKSYNAIYVKGFADIAQYLKENIQPGDLVLTMGAGDVYKIGEMMV